jgi:hypothetical protein
MFGLLQSDHPIGQGQRRRSTALGDLNLVEPCRKCSFSFATAAIAGSTAGPALRFRAVTTTRATAPRACAGPAAHRAVYFFGHARMPSCVLALFNEELTNDRKLLTLLESANLL